MINPYLAEFELLTIANRWPLGYVLSRKVNGKALEQDQTALNVQAGLDVHTL